MNGLRRYWIPVVVFALLLGNVLSAAQSTRAAAAPPISTLTAIRAAYHPEATPRYDRVVFEFNGALPLIDVHYVSSAILQVRMTPAQAHNAQGASTAPARIRITNGLSNVKEVVRASDVEASVIYGIGLAERAEIRVITLGNPSRVVVDVLNQ